MNEETIKIMAAIIYGSYSGQYGFTDDAQRKRMAIEQARSLAGMVDSSAPAVVPKKAKAAPVNSG